MQRPWMPPARWIFVTATLLGLFSTLQAYRLSTLNMKPMDIQATDLLVLNLAYWYVPALLLPTIFRLAYRFRLDSVSWHPLGLHGAAAFSFSIVHFGAMIGVRTLLWPNAGKPPDWTWASFGQRIFLGNLDWSLMTYTTIVGLAYALWYHRESQASALNAARLETRLVETRLRTLEAELHPHFLFNTLHAISTLIHSKPDAADRMISRLSDLLRLTFDRTGSARISLQEELEFLQKYLEIEQTRFQDRLGVTFEIDPDTLDAEVPRLILQPLVENAIKHGLSPKPGHGLITITAERRNGSLSLEVRDNGVGLNPRSRARLHEGVGLSNTRDRLDCLYGSAHKLEFSDGNGGLAVRLEFPFQPSSPTGTEQTAIRVA
jgi:two-component system LytT family sensor kinase